MASATPAAYFRDQNVQPSDKYSIRGLWSPSSVAESGRRGDRSPSAFTDIQLASASGARGKTQRPTAAKRDTSQPCKSETHAIAESIVVYDDESGHGLLGEIQFELGTTMGLGSGQPSGPNVVMAIRRLSKDHAASFRKEHMNIAEGMAYLWVKAPQEALNRESLRKVKPLCQFDVSLGNGALKQMFLKSKGP